MAGAATLVDQVDYPPGRQDRSLLPGANMTQMFAGKIERTVRLAQRRVIWIAIAGIARPDAEIVWHLGPCNGHRLFKLVAMAGMKPIDRGTAELNCSARGR